MRDRAWRRHIEEKKVKSRLKRFSHQNKWWYSGYDDANNLNRRDPVISDYIGGYHYKMFKTYTTNDTDSTYKCKYSPNKGRVRWRDKNKIGTREYHKKEFHNILKEYGLK